MGVIKRVDGNQREIVNALRKAGISVLILSAVGKGCPDILAGVNGKNVLMEIKDGNKCPSARKLTPLEQSFHDGWLGQVCIVKDAAEALELAYSMGEG